MDTNVFLHCTFFTDLDWRTLVSEDEVFVTICPAVFRELDKKKFAASSKRDRDRAKRVVKRIWELAKDDRPVQFREGCWLWLTCRDPENAAREVVVDDVIIASALDEHERGDHVTLISTEGGMLTKAMSTRKLGAAEVPDEWLLPDEPDEQERENRELKRRLAKYEAAVPKLRLTLGGDTYAEYDVLRRPPLSAEQLESMMAECRKETPLMKPRFSFGGSLAVSLGEIPDTDVEEYNREVEQYYKDMWAYLERLPQVFEPRDRTIEVEITLENNGSASAEDVDIRLMAEADGQWREDMPPETEDMPGAPAPPKTFAESLRDMTTYPMVRDIEPFRAYRENAVALDLDEETPREAAFHVQLVKPGLPVKLPIRYFEFASFGAVRSFKIAYRLVGKNLHAPEDAKLSIKIDTEASSQQ